MTVKVVKKRKVSQDKTKAKENKETQAGLDEKAQKAAETGGKKEAEKTTPATGNEKKDELQQKNGSKAAKTTVYGEDKNGMLVSVKKEKEVTVKKENTEEEESAPWSQETIPAEIAAVDPPAEVPPEGAAEVAADDTIQDTIPTETTPVRSSDTMTTLEYDPEIPQHDNSWPMNYGWQKPWNWDEWQDYGEWGRSYWSGDYWSGDWENGWHDYRHSQSFDSNSDISEPGLLRALWNRADTDDHLEDCLFWLLFTTCATLKHKHLWIFATGTVNF